MKLAVHLAQPLMVQMSVNLGRGDVGMPQHFLDDAQIRPPGQQVRGEAVAQQVRMDLQIDHGGPLFHNLPQTVRGEPGAAHADENVAAGAAVTSLDSIEAPARWRRSNLTDGWAPGVGALGGTADGDLAGLKKQREALWTGTMRSDERETLAGAK